MAAHALFFPRFIRFIDLASYSFPLAGLLSFKEFCGFFIVIFDLYVHIQSSELILQLIIPHAEKTNGKVMLDP